jgi:hypothetical protein
MSVSKAGRHHKQQACGRGSSWVESGDKRQWSQEQSLKIGTVSGQRQCPPCSDKKFVITMCERALSSERSQDHGRILQRLFLDIPIISLTKIHRLHGGNFSVGNDKESRECLKFLVNNSWRERTRSHSAALLNILYICQDVVLRLSSKSQTSTKNSLALCLRLSPQSNICEA